VTLLVAATVMIYGKVQGVSFRYHIKELAYSLGVDGWVRNRIDGSVEAFLQGEDIPVNQLIEWCRKGPAEAEVVNIDYYYSSIDQDLSAFKVRPTC